GVGGAATIVLAILGLIGILPVPLASVAVIAIGLSLLVGGGTVATQYSRLLARTEPGYAAQVVGGGMTHGSLMRPGRSGVGHSGSASLPCRDIARGRGSRVRRSVASGEDGDGATCRDAHQSDERTAR